MITEQIRGTTDCSPRQFVLVGTPQNQNETNILLVYLHPRISHLCAKPVNLHSRVSRLAHMSFDQSHFKLSVITMGFRVCRSLVLELGESTDWVSPLTVVSSLQGFSVHQRNRLPDASVTQNTFPMSVF